MIEVIDKYKKSSFIRGEFDCCTFANDMVMSKTGKDLFEQFRGKYTTLAQAKSLIKTIGSIDEYLDEHFERVTNHNFAQRGDLVTFENETGLGVVWFNCVLSMNPENGLVAAKDKIKTIWRVQ